VEHVKTNGLALAVQAWPGAPAPPERTVVGIHGLTSNHTVCHFTYDAERTASGGVRSKVRRHAIEEEVANLHCRLVVAPGTNHYTILLSSHDLVRREVAAFLAARAPAVH
jgi:hypothetical protein